METMNQLIVSYKNTTDSITNSIYISFFLLLVHIPVLSSEYCNSSIAALIGTTSSIEMSFQNTAQTSTIPTTEYYYTVAVDSTSLSNIITTTEYYYLTNTIVVTTDSVQDVSDSCNTQTGIMISR